MRKAYALPIVFVFLLGAALSHAQDGKKGALTAQDYVEIQMLYAQYNHNIDSGNIEGYVACSRRTGHSTTTSDRRACARS
jgi:hypothetical protein